MRPFSPKVTKIVALAAALLPSLPATALGLDQVTVLQAPVSESGLTILAGGEKALAISDGDRIERLRLQNGERLEAVAELERGFVTAGVRDEQSESELVFIISSGAGTRRLPPIPAGDSLQLRPILLVAGGTLVGAAWLEGPDPGRLRVKTADWDGAEWGPVVTVSRPSEGSQTGLAGTVLHDGSALLVWSQFDGQDDDIIYSWREESTWSPPRRVGPNNAQPDIAPALNFTERGALLAWSRFDGSDYRLWTASFERGSWEDVRSIGERGSLFPEILHRNSRIYTIVRSAAPRGWSVWSWSKTGTVESASFVPIADARRPMLLRQDANRVTLAWPQNGRVADGKLERVP